MTQPKRPTHPDFEVLRLAVVANDDAGDRGKTPPQIIQDDLGVDLESVMYMATQRALRMVGAQAPPHVHAAMATMWLDAFAAGVKFQKDRTS